MKLRIYNIQLLPLDHQKTADAGQARYLKMFTGMNQEVTKTIKARRLVTDAQALVNDSYWTVLSSPRPQFGCPPSADHSGGMSQLIS